MSQAGEKKTIENWNGEKIQPGESRNVQLAVAESYSSMTIRIPIHLRRADNPGPVIFITAALHGDEINGTGAVRQLIQDDSLHLIRGSLILVPVLNILSFDRHSRYLPDRRDLNRSFPGSASGSLAGRMAQKIFQEIVLRSDFGIDLHTASIRRTNYPNIRGDLKIPEVKKLAHSFGGDVIVNGHGPRGSLRREACKAKCPTIILEGGEIWKVEPGIVESTVRGIRNVLKSFNMIEGEVDRPRYQFIAEKTKWIRAEKGGFLQFHIKPGEIVGRNQPLATNTTLLGQERSTLFAPFDAVVIGMTTLPAISPGEPVCHLGELPAHINVESLRSERENFPSLEGRLTEQLSSNFLVTEHGVAEK